MGGGGVSGGVSGSVSGVLEYIEAGKVGSFVASIDVRQLLSRSKNVSCLENLDISHLS